MKITHRNKTKKHRFNNNQILLQCPLDGEKASREWFTQLWNEKLVPYMKKVLSESELDLEGRFNEIYG
jgi:hypothetical protein